MPKEKSKLFTATFYPPGKSDAPISITFDVKSVSKVQAANGDKSLILRSSGEGGVLQVECH